MTPTGVLNHFWVAFWSSIWSWVSYEAVVWGRIEHPYHTLGSFAYFTFSWFMSYNLTSKPVLTTHTRVLGHFWVASWASIWSGASYWAVVWARIEHPYHTLGSLVDFTFSWFMSHNLTWTPVLTTSTNVLGYLLVAFWRAWFKNKNNTCHHDGSTTKWACQKLAMHPGPPQRLTLRCGEEAWR